jgi:pimeloyl-ACP methyl ester carboxylesterase
MFVGADVEQLRALAVHFDEQARRFNGIALESSLSIMAAQWTGAKIDRLRNDWNRQSKPSLQQVASSLRGLARALRVEADAQEQASSGATGGIGRFAPDRPAVEEAPGNVRGVIDDLKHMDGNTTLYTIREVVGEDGTSRLIISLPGTRDNWGGVGGWGDNGVYLTRDSPALQAVLAQLRRDLAGYPDAEILLVGYSQGGMLAQLVAASGEFNVAEVLTVGSPRFDDYDYGDINVTRIEHNADPIVNGTEYLDGSVFEDAGRNFRHWVDGTTPPNTGLNFGAGNLFENVRFENQIENSVHNIKTGDYDWVADQWEKSTDPTHVAARERLDRFLDGTVVDVSEVGLEGERKGGSGR